MSQPAGSSSIRGWVLYDGQCGFCSRWVKHWAGTLRRSGFEIAALEGAWIADKIKMPYAELITDIRLLTASGELVSGANVYLHVTRRIWWTWPFSVIFSLPGFNWLIHTGYRWFARNRHYVSHACGLR